MARKDLVFALTWQRNTEPVGTAMTELLRWLAREVGRTIVPRVALSYEEIFPLFERSAVDFAWLPPLSYLKLHADGLARTLCVNKRRAAYHAVLAVRANSRHVGIDNLQGARVAWVDPHSTTGYILARLDLIARGVDPKATLGEERFYGSHDAAARAVYDGRSDLLGTFAEFEGGELVRAGFSALGAPQDWRILLRGSESPPDVLAVHTAVDAELADKVKRALFATVENEQGRARVRDAFHVEAFAEPDESRYIAFAATVEEARRRGLLPHL